MNSKKNKKLRLFGISFALLGLFLFFNRCYAQENLKSILKEVSDKTEEISAIKEDDSIKKEEKEQKEFLTRKEALSKIFNLTLLENKDLENNLNNLKNLDDGQSKIKDKLIDLLLENENAYKEMGNRLEEAGSLEEIKQLAIDFKNWRAFVYNPKVEKIISFTAIIQQKNNLSIANQRLEKIKNDLEKFESTSLIKKDDYQSQFNEAILNLKDAEILNSYSEKLFRFIIANNLYPDTGLTVFKKIILSFELRKINQDLLKLNNKNLFNKEEKKFLDKNANPAGIKLYSEKSSQLIKNAYKNFVDLGQIIKEKIDSE